MRTHASARWLPVVVPLVLAVVGCNSQLQPPPRFSKPGYVLAGNDVAEGFQHNALTIVDLQNPTGQTYAIDLLRSWSHGFDLAPDGSIWMGYSGDDQNDDNHIQVYSPSKNLVKTITTCENPRAGIKFASHRAFIGCSADGSSGVIQVLDLNTLQVIRDIDVSLGDKSVLLTGSGANSAEIAFSAMTDGDDPNKGYSLLVLVDANTLKSQIFDLGPDTDIWAVIPYNNRFLLLNSESYYITDTPRHDVLLFDPQHPSNIDYLQLAANSPVWGQVENGILFAYHNPTWNSLNDVPQRSITRTDLSSGESAAYPLPDNFDAHGLTIWNGEPCVTYYDIQKSVGSHGIYCLDGAGILQMRISVPYASGFIVP